MKKLALSLVAVIAAVILFGQSPHAFKYQTLVRDNIGEILSNQNVSFQISILEGSITGTVTYVESHDTITNEFGLVNLEIGNGDVVSGSFADIPWGLESYFLQIELDEDGGMEYQLMGTTQLLAVPYSLYSETTGDTSRWRKNYDDLYYKIGNIGIGTDNPDPWIKLDIRGSGPDDAGLINLGNSDNTHMLRFFGGRENDPNPFIMWKEGDPLRFSTDEGGWSEKMRITSGGQVGIGTETPDASAILDLDNDSKGFLLPRMTEMEIMSISSPADGLQVYNTDEGKLYIFVSSEGVWKEISYGTSTMLPPANFSIGAGGSCTNTIVNGNYRTDYFLGMLEYVTIEVNVLNTGSYIFVTDTINGYSFSASGTFSTTGIQNIDLIGNGTPIETQTDNFTVTGSNSSGYCVFTIIVQDYLCDAFLIDNRDGQFYSTLKIGNQCWMTKNLNIGILGGQSNNGTIEKSCYDGIEVNCDTYGGLYMWNEMMDYTIIEGTQGICPDGWHVPSDLEWCVLENRAESYPTGSTIYCSENGVRGVNAGDRLKSSYGWYAGGNGNNLTGFNALPAGRCGGGCDKLTYNTYYWSSTMDGASTYFFRTLDYFHSGVERDSFPVSYMYSVRCIKD